MKKVFLLLALSFGVLSCDVEDDGPRYEQVLVEVTDADLPDFFEQNKSYLIDVTYLLPNACHQPLGIHVFRGAQAGDERRDIYITAVAQHDPAITTCSAPSTNLEKESSFTILIDEDEPYTFYLWTGVDDQGESIFTEVEVPVQ